MSLIGPKRPTLVRVTLIFQPPQPGLVKYLQRLCIEDEDLSRQAEALCWQRWKLATHPDPNTWELVTPLALPFVP